MIPIGRGPAVQQCLLAALLLASSSLPLAAQQRVVTDAATLQRLLEAEDARGTGTSGVTLLIEGLASRDPTLRRVAVRGIGRLQRPDLALKLVPALADPVAAIRGEAATAITQSLIRVRRGSVADPTQLSVADAQAALLKAISSEADRDAIGAMADAIGRLPLPDSAAARTVERAIVMRAASGPTFLMVHGLYWLALARRATGTLEPSSLALLRATAVVDRSAEVRRLAILTLTTAGALDSATTTVAATDADPQVRRLALAGTRALSPATRAGLVMRAIGDTSPIVRIVAVGAARYGTGAPDCAPIIGAVADHDPYVALTAIDSLGSPCATPATVVTALTKMLDGSLPTFPGPPDHRWQAGAHALRALARVDSSAAARFLPRYQASARWGERLAAADAARNSRDRVTLFRLAVDADHNVREAALAGLAQVMKHGADSSYIAALASPGYQVVLEAATDLAGSTDTRALPAILDAFDRLSAERKENAKDPRVALLKRIAEMGSSATAPRLTRYLADFDTLIAATVATTLTKWGGSPVQAHPAPLPIRAEPLAQTFLDRTTRLKVTMSASSGGGSFVVELYGNEAPATVARIVRLAREHFYDGHVFQRVEPNFVVQGGGPDASEYVGDADFMRDELGTRSHGIGTIGISSRGRDTGDAQWFINVVDNPRLDHEYTVFGRIVSGLGVARQILEGDAIGKVEVVKAP